MTAKHSALKKADDELQENGGVEEENGTDKLLKEFEELSEALRDCERSNPTLPKNDLKIIAIKVFEETLQEGKAIHHDDDTEDIFIEVAKQLMARSINTHVYLFLILTFLVLVSTSNNLFQLLKCREFEVPDEDSQSYLYIDYSVDCSSARYSTAKIFAIVNIVICELGRANANIPPCSLVIGDISSLHYRVLFPLPRPRRHSIPVRGLALS